MKKNETTKPEVYFEIYELKDWQSSKILHHRILL